MALDVTVPDVGDGTRRSLFARIFANDTYLNGKPSTRHARTTPGTGIAAGETKYLDTSGHSTAESERWTVVGKAGIYKNLRVQLTGDPGVGKTITITFRYGATAPAIGDSALTVTITGDGSTVLTGSDLTHTVTVAAGGIFTFKAVGGAGASTREVSIAVEVDSAV